MAFVVRRVVPEIAWLRTAIKTVQKLSEQFAKNTLLRIY